MQRQMELMMESLEMLRLQNTELVAKLSKEGATETEKVPHSVKTEKRPSIHADPKLGYMADAEQVAYAARLADEGKEASISDVHELPGMPRDYNAVEFNITEDERTEMPLDQLLAPIPYTTPKERKAGIEATRKVMLEQSPDQIAEIPTWIGNTLQAGSRLQEQGQKMDKYCKYPLINYTATYLNFNPQSFYI